MLHFRRLRRLRLEWVFLCQYVFSFVFSELGQHVSWKYPD